MPDLKVISVILLVVVVTALPTAQSELPLTVLVGTGSYYYARQNKNWEQANKFCRENNLRLISLETNDELKAVSDWMIKHVDLPDNWQLWTSGSDSAVPGSFIWTATTQPLLYNAWAPGQPDIVRNNEHCMAVWQHQGKLQFNDLDCAASRYFLCEKPQ